MRIVTFVVVSFAQAITDHNVTSPCSTNPPQNKRALYLGRSIN